MKFGSYGIKYIMSNSLFSINEWVFILFQNGYQSGYPRTFQKAKKCKKIPSLYIYKLGTIFCRSLD